MDMRILTVGYPSTALTVLGNVIAQLVAGDLVRFTAVWVTAAGPATAHRPLGDVTDAAPFFLIGCAHEKAALTDEGRNLYRLRLHAREGSSYGLVKSGYRESG